MDRRFPKRPGASHCAADNRAVAHVVRVVHRRPLMPFNPPRAESPMEGRRPGKTTSILIAALVTIGSLGGAACSANNSVSPTRQSSTVQDAGATDAAIDGHAAAALTAEAKFRALEPDLVKTCGGNGGVCHVNGSLKAAPRWLAPPDDYISAKTFAGVIPADDDLEHSILLTQIEHTGPALVNSPALFAKVSDWIAAEMNAAVIPESDAVVISEGLNTIDLSKAMVGLDGAQLLFNATTGVAGLTLSEMQLVGPTVHILTITDPYFVIEPAKGPVVVDPASNGFSGDLTVNAGGTVDFYEGILLLPKVAVGDKLALALNHVHLENPPDPDAGATASHQCKSVASFTANAVPQFKIDLGAGATCLGCHGGGDDVAMNAMDLSAVGVDDAKACNQALYYVNLADKPNSQLILTPMGQANPVHPITTAPASFGTAILAWLKNE